MLRSWQCWSGKIVQNSQRKFLHPKRSKEITRMNKSNDVNGVRSFALRLLFLATVASRSMVASSAPNDASKPDFSNVRRFIQEQLMAKSIPSMAVAVARNGTILWEEAFGWADRENRVPATEHTMYYTASVTKSFTETAIMILHERKKLDVDRPVNDYLGTAKLTSTAFNPAAATIRRVATHMAGLTTFNPTNPHPVEEMIRRYGVLFWPPGERYDYSNFGSIILRYWPLFSPPMLRNLRSRRLRGSLRPPMTSCLRRYLGNGKDLSEHTETIFHSLFR
jgi:hypothetical protein